MDEFAEWDRFEALYESSLTPLIAMDRYREIRRREQLKAILEARHARRKEQLASASEAITSD